MTIKTSAGDFVCVVFISKEKNQHELKDFNLESFLKIHIKVIMWGHLVPRK